MKIFLLTKFYSKRYFLLNSTYVSAFYFDVGVFTKYFNVSDIRLFKTLRFYCYKCVFFVNLLVNNGKYLHKNIYQ